jgi:antirestriction protein ArdC
MASRLSNRNHSELPQKATDSIIEMLERGVAPRQKPREAGSTGRIAAPTLFM